MRPFNAPRAAAAVVLLCAAPAARAQLSQVNSSAHVTSDDGQYVTDGHARGEHLPSAVAEASGVRASASASLGGAEAHLYAGTTGYSSEAGAYADFSTIVTFTNVLGTAESTGAAYNPLQVFVDAVFFRTAAGADPWNDGWMAGSGYADAQGSVVDVATGELVGSATVSLGSGMDQPYASATLLIPRPPVVGGSATYRISFAFNASANHGWTTDYSHTAHLFLPTVQGIAWSAADGAFASQSRPAWAADSTVPFEVTPNTTVTPEPASLVLVSGGGLAVGVLARRRRRRLRVVGHA